MEKKIAIYSRKSRFTGKGESIENQIELCRQYIRLHFGDRFAGEALVYEDEGFSGGNLKRPRFRAMMGDAKRGLLSTVVVYRLDRISRNIGDFAGLIEELNTYEVSFLSIREQFDTTSPMGRAMMYIASVFSQLERETIAERIRDNMQELAKTGRWLGGTTPTGYASEGVSSVDVDGRTRKACRLRPIPEEGALVKQIYRSFLENGSLKETEEVLRTQKARTKNGKEFQRFAIKAILTNPVYAQADEEVYRYFRERGAELCSPQERFDGRHGMMVYNRTLQRQGKASEPRDIREWIVSVGEHEGLIRGENWVRVQLLLEQNSSKTFRRPRSQTAILSGLLFCGACRSPMRSKSSGRVDADGRPVYRYLCTRKEKSCGAECRMKNVDGRKLDRAVIEELGSLPEDFEELRRHLTRYEREALWEEKGQERLMAKRETIQKEIRTLVEALGRAEETGAKGYILERVERLHGELSVVEEELKRFSCDAELGVDWEKEILFLKSFSAVFADMEIREQRLALQALVERIVWDGETVHVYLRGQ